MVKEKRDLGEHVGEVKQKDKTHQVEPNRIINPLDPENFPDDVKTK